MNTYEPTASDKYARLKKDSGSLHPGDGERLDGIQSLFRVFWVQGWRSWVMASKLVRKTLKTILVAYTAEIAFLRCQEVWENRLCWESGFKRL